MQAPGLELVPNTDQRRARQADFVPGLRRRYLSDCPSDARDPPRGQPQIP